ncbi:unnamed protein product [Adineta ricciae]|uniref:Uncharacterized protein n=1 Tax=Adineta ricciae TaxID=249248 RepID=A0A813ZFH9_ADIRI|nr:unnamed protein product [Adineta ricciae]
MYNLNSTITSATRVLKYSTEVVNINVHRSLSFIFLPIKALFNSENKQSCQSHLSIKYVRHDQKRKLEKAIVM